MELRFLYKIENRVNQNLLKVSLWFTLPALLILSTIFILIISQDSSYKEAYINIQQDLFFYLNKKLSAYPRIEHNLTQLGDVMIIFPFVAVFSLYASKYWESLLNASLLSLVVSAGLKRLFSIPRPARMFNMDSFTIVGRILKGENSLPSGHSITAFIVVTLLLFAFMPKKRRIYQFIWTIFILIIGTAIASSRIGVGAHYPLDVLAGSSIGYILAIVGIWLAHKTSLWNWIKENESTKVSASLYFTIRTIILTIWEVVIIKKIFDDNIPIFYISSIAIIITLYLNYKHLCSRISSNKN